MTTISAKGKTAFGTFNVTVTGDKMVKEIECSDLIRGYIKKSIREAAGTMANGYAPEPDSMLQAYAFLCDMFGERNVKVDGELEELPCEEGVIY